MKKNSTPTQYGNLPKNVIKPVYEKISWAKNVEEVLTALQTVSDNYNHTEAFILLNVAIRTAFDYIQLATLQAAGDIFIKKYDKFIYPEIKEPRLRKIYLDIDLNYNL